MSDISVNLLKFLGFKHSIVNWGRNLRCLILINTLTYYTRKSWSSRLNRTFCKRLKDRIQISLSLIQELILIHSNRALRIVQSQILNITFLWANCHRFWLAQNRYLISILASNQQFLASLRLHQINIWKIPNHTLLPFINEPIPTSFFERGENTSNSHWTSIKSHKSLI
jgi:hypothetical protein